MADARMDRLNALATGGSAGLASYDQAKASVAANNSGALDRALARGGSNTPAGAQSAVQALVGKYTQGYTNDAASARSNAGSQVGYDASALDSFMAKQQSRLDQQRLQGDRSAELSNMSLQEQIRQQDLKTEGLLDEMRDPAAGFGKLSQGAQDDMVAGRANELQGQALSENQSTAQKADKDFQADAEARKRAAFSNLPTDQANQQAGVQGAAPAYVDPKAPAPAFKPQGQTIDQAQETARNTIAEQLQQYEQNRLALNQFKQDAASEFGMDRYMAQGRYPLDEVALTDRQKELDEVDSYALDRELAAQDKLDKETQLGLEQNGISYSKLKSAATATGISPSAGAQLAQTDKFNEIQEAALARVSQDGNAESKFVTFTDDLQNEELGLSAQEIAFYQQYFRSLFYTGPSQSQLDNAAVSG